MEELPPRKLRIRLLICDNARSPQNYSSFGDQLGDQVMANRLPHFYSELAAASLPVMEGRTPVGVARAVLDRRGTSAKPFVDLHSRVFK